MFQSQLKVAIIQPDLVWEKPEQNRYEFQKKIVSIQDDVDLIILPEMFTSGFTMDAQVVAEIMDGDSVKWMKRISTEYNAAIIGSLVISEDDNNYNRLLFVEPNGAVSCYDKRHTFTLAGEQKVYTAGDKKLIVEYKGWKICPLICYDLRFPVWARNVESYDILLFVANWPKPRISAWNTLLKARAIENMCYCIGVNRVGVDGLDIEYSGHSAAYDVLGNEISNIQPFKEQIEIITLEKRHVESYRNKLKFLDDMDSFTVH